MGRKVRIILNVILGLVLIGCIVGLVFWSIHCWELNHTMFLKEFNAQMDKYGYYKEDIKLFDQQLEEVRFVWCLVGNVLCWVGVFGVILGNIICGFFDDFDAFRY